MGTLVSFTNKTDHHKVIEILLKVVVNTLSLTISMVNSIQHMCFQLDSGSKNIVGIFCVTYVLGMVNNQYLHCPEIVLEKSDKFV